MTSPVRLLSNPVDPVYHGGLMAERLPIYDIEQQLVAGLREHRRLIVSAPTGSGKSTQVPQMLLDQGLLGAGQVVILQPRRLAARLLAARVAWERKAQLGREVGYQIRFENVTSTDTRIRFVTEGLLLRQMVQDPELRGVSAVIFDEFHERHLYGDITLARARDLQETTRPDLKLLVMSATLDAAPLEQYLKPCRVLESQGRTHPVEIEFATAPGYLDKRPVWDQAAEAFSDFVRSGGQGDVLVFMPGGFEISQTIDALRRRDEARGFILLPLHGELPPRDQDAAVARYDKRKVVIATNVAETSLTIDGIRCVIDSGLARIPRYDPYRGINTLLIEKISRASADQRAGRAGRTAPGLCRRLWSREEHAHRPAQELPEVKRLDLAEVVLTLKAAGVEDKRAFRWLEPPNRASLEHAELLLKDLGALDNASGVITDLGQRMLAFPLHPRYSRMLLAAQEYGCVRQVALIAALPQGRDLMVWRQGKQVEEARDDLFGGETQSDFFVLMRAWRYADRNGYNLDRCRQVGIHAQAARQVGPLFEQFLNIAEREGLDVSEKRAAPDAIQRCVLLGFSDHVARRLDEGTLRCQLVHERRGVLARESVVQSAPLLVATEIHEIQSGTGKDRELNVLLSLATAIKEEWLRELFPSDFTETVAVVYDTTQRRVFGERRKQFRDLVLEAGRSEDVPLDAAARILSAEVVAGRCVLKNWDEAVEQWIVRVNRLREWITELGIPAIGSDDRQALIEQICHGARSYKEIKDKPVWPVMKSWLSGQQQAWVEEYAPERIELPGGKRAKIAYSTDGPPTVAARIQDLYGVKQGLWIAQHRVPVRIQVLAPNQRPVQMTENLATFWKETYPKLKVELQRKYPRHEWR